MIYYSKLVISWRVSTFFVFTFLFLVDYLHFFFFWMCLFNFIIWYHHCITVPPQGCFCKAAWTRVLCVFSNICDSYLLTKDGLVSFWHFLLSIWLFGCVQNSWVNSSLAWPSGGPSDRGYETPREGLSPVGPAYEKEKRRARKLG